MILDKRSRIGVIGAGKTGVQFARLFRSHGFRVIATTKRTQKRNAELIRSSDVIIFALPLSHAADLMRSELRSAVRKNQLILDLSSLKMRETEAMKVAAGEVIGMHPLFGPSTDPKGERIILCPVRCAKATLQSLRSLLKKMGLQVSEMPPAAHDELMATVQVIPHLKSLLMADVLRLRRTDLTQILRQCTPTYELEFNVIGRFLDDHPDLYMPIIFRNPDTLNVLRTLQSSIADYIRIAERVDLPAAEERYELCKRHFRSHLGRARRHSEACIRTLLSLKS